MIATSSNIIHLLRSIFGRLKIKFNIEDGFIEAEITAFDDSWHEEFWNRMSMAGFYTPDFWDRVEIEIQKTVGLFVYINNKRIVDKKGNLALVVSTINNGNTDAETGEHKVRIRVFNIDELRSSERLQNIAKYKEKS